MHALLDRDAPASYALLLRQRQHATIVSGLVCVTAALALSPLLLTTYWLATAWLCWRGGVCFSYNLTPVHAISFGIPLEKFREPWPKERRHHVFSSNLPGSDEGGSYEHNYITDSEEAYYNLNSAAWFAITHKRAGWDAMRHYEIIAAGALPYFLDLERCPLHTLQALPKAKLLEARHLPGMPSLHKVRMAFGHNSSGRLRRLRALPTNLSVTHAAYESLRRHVRTHALRHLTTTAVAMRVLRLSGAERLVKSLQARLSNGSSSDSAAPDTHGRQPPSSLCRILLLTPHGSWDYQALTVQHGFLSLGCSVDTLPEMPYVFSDGPEPASQYGRGFTWARLLPASWRGERKQATIEVRLRTTNFYSLVIAATGSNQPMRSAEWDALLSRVDRHKVVCLHGNDALFTPPVWRWWVPRFCSRLFARELCIRPRTWDAWPQEMTC